MNLFTKNTFEILNYINPWHLLIVIGLFCIIILCLIIFIYKIKSNKKFIKQYVVKNNLVRQFRLDLIHGTFTYFDIENPSKKYSLDISEFYRSFSYQDQDDLKEWLDNLLKQNIETKNYFERFVLNKSIKSSVFVVYKFIKANYEQKIIYLESTLYPNIKRTDITKTIDTNFLPLYKLSKNFDDLKKKKKKEICVYLIHLYPKNSLISKDSEDIKHIHLLNLLNKYLLFFKKPFIVSFYDPSTLCLIVKTKKEKKIEDLRNKLIEYTNTYFSLHSLKETHIYKIGIHLNKEIENVSLSTIVEKAYSTVKFAKESTSKSKYMVYSDALNSYETYKETIKKETYEILDSNLFKFYFLSYAPTTLLKSNSVKSRGYIVSCIPKSENINDINKFEEIIYENNLTDRYLEILINNAIERLENSNIKKTTSKNLIIKIKLPYLSNIITYLKNHNLGEYTITFMIDEYDFIYSNYNIEKTLNDFEKIKDLNQQVAINIENYQIQIDLSLIKACNSISIDECLTKSIKDNTRNKILVYKLIHLIKSLKKQILINGVNSWPIGELLTAYGASFISGSIVSKKTESIIDSNND